MRLPFNEIMQAITDDPILLGKLQTQVHLKVDTANGEHLQPSAYTFGNQEGAVTPVVLRCTDVPCLESILNGENEDRLTIWSSQKLALLGDVSTCVLIADALFRYAEGA